MRLEKKMLVIFIWMPLLILLYLVSCEESINNKRVAHENKFKNAIANYSKRISHVDKKWYFKFVYPDDSSYNFVSRHYYTTDSSFIDYEILGSSATALQNSIYFEIKNGHWYMFDGFNWRIFYDGKKLYPVELFYANKLLTPYKIYKLNNEDLLSFKSSDTEYDISLDPNEYIFSPRHGIVLIKTPPEYARRTDFNFNPKELKLVRYDSALIIR